MFNESGQLLQAILQLHVGVIAVIWIAAIALDSIKGAQAMKCKLWTGTLEFSRLRMPNSRFALHGLAPP